MDINGLYMGCINHPAMFFSYCFTNIVRRSLSMCSCRIPHLLHSWSAKLWHHGASCNLWCIAHGLLRIREGLAEGWGCKMVENQKHLRKRWWKTSLFSSKSMRCQELKKTNHVHLASNPISVIATWVPWKSAVNVLGFDSCCHHVAW